MHLNLLTLCERNGAVTTAIKHLMAVVASRVGERFARLRDKFPIVARAVKSEFQNSERIRLTQFTVRFGTRESAV